MTIDYRAMCAELLEALEHEWIGDRRAEPEIAIRARAALAQPEPEPEESTKAEIHAIADALLDGDSASRIDFARAVLARWGTSNLAQVRSSLGDGSVVSDEEIMELMPQQMRDDLNA